MSGRIAVILTALIILSVKAIAAIDTARSQNGPIIYAVEVMGNLVTSSRLILRQMKLKPGMIATPKALERDRLNIESLGLFNRVEMQLAEDEGRAVVQVRVTEPFYIYPYLIGRYDGSKSQRVILGMGIYHYNFRGQGQKLNASFWGGYARGFIILHDDAWFSINGRYGLDGRLFYYDNEITDPLDRDVRRELLGIRLSVKRRLGVRHHLEFGTAWEITTSQSDDYTLTPGNRDRMLSLEVKHKNDKRDYRYYPRSGYYLVLITEANRLVDLNHNFFRELIDMRSYGSHGPFTLALRVWGEFGQYELPYYRWLAVGRDLVRAGETFSNPDGILLGGNLELRFNLVKPFYWSFEMVPVAGPYLRNLKFSLEGVVFGDRGFYASNLSGFRNDFRAWGFGIQAQLPYIKTAHFLVGWTPGSKFDEPSITVRNGVTF